MREGPAGRPLRALVIRAVGLAPALGHSTGSLRAGEVAVFAAAGTKDAVEDPIQAYRAFAGFPPAGN